MEMKNKTVITGKLAFFNYDEQVAHLEDYQIETEVDRTIIESGRFIVINRTAWRTLKIQELQYTEVQ